MKLAVTADVHADDFGAKIDPDSGLNARWVDSLGMIRWVANDARGRGADALIVAGDLTEARHPAPWRVASIAEAIDEFDGPTVLVRGNHDGERAGRSIVDALAGGRPGWSGFSRPGIAVVGDVAIACVPYLDRQYLRSRPGFETLAEPEIIRILGEAFVSIAAGLYVQAQTMAPRSVLVVHIGLSGGLMSDTQAVFLGDRSLVVDSGALGAIGFDAIVAGHFHLHQVLSTEPLIVYAGAPTRTDFGEADQTKGYLIVDVDEAGTRMEFVPTPARRMVTLRGDGAFADVDVADALVRGVDLDPDVDEAELRRALYAAGALEVMGIRRRPVSGSEVAGGLSEDLAPEALLETYLEGDPDRDALVAMGRRILGEVA